MTDPKDAAIMRLRALSLENYRAARWQAINDARENGLIWAEIGEALGSEKSAVRRFWLNDGPERD